MWIYATPDGGSKFEDVEVEGTATRVVDGVPPLLVSGAFPVNALLFVDSLKALPTGKLILLRGDSG